MSQFHIPALRRVGSLAAALAAVACSSDAGSSLAPSAPSAANVALPFHGTLESNHTSQYDIETNTILVHLVGTGTATHLGRYTLTGELVLDAETIAGPERMTLMAANGDLLFASGTAQGTPSEDGLTVNSVEDLTITGGTGRFAGATGSFVLRQWNLDVTRSSPGAFEGTILLAQ